MTEAGEREWQRGEYTISTDNNRLDIHTIHDFIANQSYWAQGRSTETMQRALDNSLNFGLYKQSADWLCTRRYGLCDVRLDCRRFCTAGLPWARLIEVVDGSDFGTSGTASVSPLGFGNQRRTHLICALWFHPSPSA